MIYDRTFQTGNRTMDTLLTEKNLLCERDHITLTCIADASLLSFMEALDLYTLFGNAIDNAAECVRQYENPAWRQILLRIGGQGSIVSIHMENYCDAPLTFEDGIPHTTKGDSTRHGFGTKSIRHVVEKYGGEMRMSVSDSVFLLDIMFFNPIK